MPSRPVQSQLSRAGRSPNPVLVADPRQQVARFEPVERRTERHLDDAGVAADLDRPGDRGAILDLRDLHPEQLGRTLEAVVCRGIEVGPGPDDRDRRRVLERTDAPLTRDRLGAYLLVG